MEINPMVVTKRKMSVDPNIYKFAEQLVIGSGEGPRHNDAEFADWRDEQTQDLAEDIQNLYDGWLEFGAQS